MNVGLEFREIAHCGSKIIFRRTATDEGRLFTVTVTGSRPVPAAFYSMYALQQGIPVADCEIRGIGS
jgi:hypothetical protein